GSAGRGGRARRVRLPAPGVRRGSGKRARKVVSDPCETPATAHRLDKGMAKKRVHEIAKEKGISSKEVLAVLQEAGLDVKAAASSVDEADVARAFGNGAKAEASEPEAQSAEPPPEAGDGERPAQGQP